MHRFKLYIKRIWDSFSSTERTVIILLEIFVLSAAVNFVRALLFDKPVISVISVIAVFAVLNGIVFAYADTKHPKDTPWTRYVRSKKAEKNDYPKNDGDE